jgi:hypothetical protein
MWFGKLFHAIGNCILLSIERLEQPDSDSPLEITYLISVRTIAFTMDCLNMLTLLYLFYCQGITAEKLEEKNRGILSDEVNNINTLLRDK